MSEILSRLCPVCGEEMVYGSQKGYDIAEKKHSPCMSCSHNKPPAEKKKFPDRESKQMYDTQGVYVGNFIFFTGTDTILATNNLGTFIGLYAGENTYLLPSKEFYSIGNKLYQLMNEKFVDNSTTSSIVQCGQNIIRENSKTPQRNKEVEEKD